MGKTTLAVKPARELQRRSKTVVVVDADPQASALAWLAPKKLGFDVRAELMTTGTIAQWLRDILKQRADYILLDTPAGLGTVFRSTVEVADLIIIPCGPSSFDLSAARTTLSTVAAALRNDARSSAQIVLVPTRVDMQTPEGQQIAAELGSLGERVRPPLSHDVYFVRAFAQGVSVVTAALTSSSASEVRQLTNFVVESLDSSGSQAVPPPLVQRGSSDRSRARRSRHRTTAGGRREGARTAAGPRPVAFGVPRRGDGRAQRPSDVRASRVRAGREKRGPQTARGGR